MAKYSTRIATSVEEVRSTHTFRELREGWSPAIDDPDLYYTMDPSGFFLGELDGKIIACISIIKYGDQYAYLDHYIVDKPYRGKGYGVALFRFAMASLSPTHNCGLDAVVGKVSMFERWGFKSAWIVQRYMIDLAQCASLLHKFVPPADVAVSPAKEVDLDLLSGYDTTAYGAPRHNFLKALLEAPNSINLAAIISRSHIVGFISATKAIDVKDGWRISPLFADNAQIAMLLLREINLQLAKDLPERKVALMDVPVDTNPEAKALAEELHGTIREVFNEMFTKGAPDISKEIVFGW